MTFPRNNFRDNEIKNYETTFIMHLADCFNRNGHHSQFLYLYQVIYIYIYIYIYIHIHICMYIYMYKVKYMYLGTGCELNSWLDSSVG